MSNNNSIRCGGGCGGYISSVTKSGACGKCVPRCQWAVDTYQEIVDNRDKYANSYVSVADEGNAVYHISADGEILEIHRTTIEDDTFVPTVGAFFRTRVINKAAGMIYEYLSDGTYMQYPATHVTV